MTQVAPRDDGSPQADRSLLWYRGQIAPRRRSPLDLVIIQSTSFCNIDCSYCYLASRNRKHQFDVNQLTPLIRRLHAADLFDQRVSFVWHAGEPLTLPAGYYREAMQMIAAALPPQCTASHFFQTNATLIGPDYLDLFSRPDVHVGVSIDGPQDLHDRHRVTRNKAGTHARAMAGISSLRSRGIPFSAIAVVTRHTLDQADAFYSFFADLGATQLGLNIDEIEGVNAASSLGDCGSIALYKDFLKTLIRRSRADGDQLRIREFGNAAGLVMEAAFSDGTVSSEANPLSIISVDAEGRLFTYSPELVGQGWDPDHSFAIGHIDTIDFAALWSDPRFVRLESAVRAGVERCRESCDYFSVCGGGAPANKWAEHRSFDVTETMFCKIKKKATFDVLEEDVLSLLTSARARRARGNDLAHRPPDPPAIKDAPMSTSFTPAAPLSQVWTAQAVQGSGAPRLHFRSFGIVVTGLALKGDRIRVASGTLDAEAVGDPPQGYKPAARIPRADWQVPSAEHIAALIRPRPAAGSRDFVTIVRPDASRIKALMALAALASDKDDDLSFMATLRGKTEAWAEAQALFDSYVAPGQAAKVLGVAVNKPGLGTTTSDPRDNRKLGLHVDSWSQQAGAERSTAPNRMCLNIGRESRRVLFVNVPIAEAARLAAGSPRADGGLGLTDMGRAFMRAYPDYPVVSLEVRPGEAYIVPTENLIHDATTATMKALDLSVAAIGEFPLPGA